MINAPSACKGASPKVLAAESRDEVAAVAAGRLGATRIGLERGNATFYCTLMMRVILLPSYILLALLAMGGQGVRKAIVVIFAYELSVTPSSAHSSSASIFGRGYDDSDRWLEADCIISHSWCLDEQ